VLDEPTAIHSHTLAPAKIRLPRPRAGLIERTDLDRRLGEALIRRSLVLLVAPAGFGKTVALMRQLQALPPDHAVAWVTADADDDLPRLLLCLVEALEPYDLPWRMAPEALVEQAAQKVGLREAVEVLRAALAATAVERGVSALTTCMPSRTCRYSSSSGCCSTACRTSGPWPSQAEPSRRWPWRACAAGAKWPSSGTPS
jgi:hypothetical protein